MNYELNFDWKDQKIKFSNNRVATLYIELCNWLYKNGYKFQGPIHSVFLRKPFTKKEAEDILVKNYSDNNFFQIFFNIENSDIYLYRGGNIGKIYRNVIKFLTNFGVDTDTIKTKGFDTTSKIKKFGEIDLEDDIVNELETTETMKKMTFINAAQLILKENDNNPMSANEIWKIIDDRDLVETKGTTPWATLNANMLAYSDNSKMKFKYKKNIFTIVETNPAKFKLISDGLQDVSDEELDSTNDDTRFWIYAPGDSSKKWEEFYNSGVIGLGWDALGDFDKLGNREDITNKLKESEPDNQSSQTNSSLAIYEFRDVMKPGDVIIPKQGTSAFLGYGIVVGDNYFDEDADSLKNRRMVEWKKKGVFNSDVKIVQKTLTDITKYPSYVKKIINLIGIEEFMDKDDFSDMDQVKTFSKFPKPFDIESELTKAQSQSEEDVLSFKSFRASEPNEKPDDLMVFNLYVKNPFSQAICVLGESGAGKSTTIDNILQKSGHIYQYIIPSTTTTGLLSQFSTSVGSSGGYVTSRLGQMIEMAYKNKDKNYTVVFDECHKTNIIEMINDELLQAVSKNRNKGVRFISLDDDTRNLYPLAKEDIRGNVLIPDNFGFIFISSNARVISGNPDFFNRVDLIELTEEDRKLNTIGDLNQKRVIAREDKKELVNQIKSKKED
jgi:hypothetical protein